MGNNCGKNLECNFVIMSNISLLIPTYNAGDSWIELLESIQTQDIEIQEKIIVDSGSNDDTVPLAKKYGFDVIQIEKSEFDHGKTRQKLIDSATKSSICVFLTQDCVLYNNNSINLLVKHFEDTKVGMAYGRQLPHLDAKVLGSHARLFNYGPNSEIRSSNDIKKLGIKTISFSNSFSAYRKEALINVGGFPGKTIMGEDVIVAAEMIHQGYHIAYVADAIVYHSHDYTFSEEFRRYFDIGVFHKQYSSLIEKYGKPTGEGLRYAKSEIRYVLKNKPMSIHKVFASLAAKWLGYKFGSNYNKLPRKTLPKLSMHKKYWLN